MPDDRPFLGDSLWFKTRPSDLIEPDSL